MKLSLVLSLVAVVALAVPAARADGSDPLTKYHTPTSDAPAVTSNEFSIGAGVNGCVSSGSGASFELDCTFENLDTGVNSCANPSSAACIVAGANWNQAEIMTNVAATSCDGYSTGTGPGELFVTSSCSIVDGFVTLSFNGTQDDSNGDLAGFLGNVTSLLSKCSPSVPTCNVDSIESSLTNQGTGAYGYLCSTGAPGVPNPGVLVGCDFTISLIGFSSDVTATVINNPEPATDGLLLAGIGAVLFAGFWRKKALKAWAS